MRGCTVWSARKRERARTEREGKRSGNYGLWSGRAEERASAKVASCDKATANGPSVMQVPFPLPHFPFSHLRSVSAANLRMVSSTCLSGKAKKE